MADARPPGFSIRLSALFSFPSRFCHPPHPTVAKVRSCSVVPSFQVSLDDVLERRHLPPLGLKDFEEWLLFVEQKSQYLYFILWIKEYNRRYAQWVKTADSEEKTRTRTRPISGTLSIFYTRAKLTFFARHSPYHLHDVSQLTLGEFTQPPMDSATDSPHPHPSAFGRVESEARAILSQSLQAFVKASFTNVSSYRAICGIIAGVVISLVFGILPLFLVIFFTTSRWLRWVAWPGLAVGSTIFISSCHGLCVGIYIFGDARQLRNFELVRPTIQKTTAMAISPITPTLTTPPSSPSPAVLIRHRWMEQSIQKEKETSGISIHSILSSSRPCSVLEDSNTGIYVSPAMDPDTGECSPPSSLHHAESHTSQEFPRTASFISHNQIVTDRQREVQESKHAENEDQFNFDGLPPLSDTQGTRDSMGGTPSLEKNASRERQLTTSRRSEVDLESGRVSNEVTAPPPPQSAEGQGLHYGNVPPFGPLTPVMSPVVVRAHWEILARSSTIGGVVSLVVVGALVGIPNVKFGSTMPMI